MAAIVRKLLKNEYVQTATVILLIVAVIFGFWYGSQAILNTNIPPVLAVVSGSMDTISDGATPGWTHPFSRTLQIGDLIVIQGVEAETLNTNYPNSDIIVYHRPDNPDELIVHRIVSSTVIDGKIYFFTKGDGNPPIKWPNSTDSMYDKWISTDPNIPTGAISEDLIIGKVLMRIPLIGYLPMLVQSAIGNNSTIIIPIIAAIIILLVIVEFIIPLFKHKKTQTKSQSNSNLIDGQNLSVNAFKITIKYTS